ncbi:MAG: hypothetical protein H6502_02165 [Candidatus Woesearchaeota archaeon]|nr:MAG: hypothetical protein H6502_02165 [Candidatus Woesearchaeota archaeon]
MHKRWWFLIGFAVFVVVWFAFIQVSPLQKITIKDELHSWTSYSYVDSEGVVWGKTSGLLFRATEVGNEQWKVEYQDEYGVITRYVGVTNFGFLPELPGFFKVGTSTFVRTKVTPSGLFFGKVINDAFFEQGRTLPDNMVEEFSKHVNANWMGPLHFSQINWEFYKGYWFSDGKKYYFDDAYHLVGDETSRAHEFMVNGPREKFFALPEYIVIHELFEK